MLSIKLTIYVDNLLSILIFHKEKSKAYYYLTLHVNIRYKYRIAVNNDYFVCLAIQFKQAFAQTKLSSLRQRLCILSSRRDTPFR